MDIWTEHQTVFCISSPPTPSPASNSHKNLWRSNNNLASDERDKSVTRAKMLARLHFKCPFLLPSMNYNCSNAANAR